MTGVPLFRQTQISWPTIVPLLFVAAILVPIFQRAELTAGPYIAVAVYGVVLLLFATLTVTVTSDGVKAAFGIGVVRKSVPLADIVSFTRVRNPWFYGWGIHSYPGGTLWNTSGLLGVECRLLSGRYVSFGTADPDALVAALQQATGKPETSHDDRPAKRGWGVQHTAGAIVGVCAIALAAASIYIGVQPPNVVVGYDSFYVSNGLYRDTIPYSSIQSVKLDADLPRIGMKTNGFAAFGTLRGNFNVDGWGNSRLFVNRNHPPFVVIETERRFFAINFEEPARTRALYDELKSHVGRKTL